MLHNILEFPAEEVSLPASPDLIIHGVNHKVILRAFIINRKAIGTTNALIIALALNHIYKIPNLHHTMNKKP